MFVDLEVLDEAGEVLEESTDEACYSQAGRLIVDYKSAFLKSVFKDKREEYNPPKFDAKLHLKGEKLLDFVSVLEEFFPNQYNIQDLCKEIEEQMAFTIQTNIQSFDAFSTVTILRYLFEQPDIPNAYTFIRKNYGLSRVDALFLAHSSGYLNRPVYNIHSLCSMSNINYILPANPINITTYIELGRENNSNKLANKDPNFGKGQLNLVYDKIMVGGPRGPLEQLPKKEWKQYTEELLSKRSRS